MARHRLRYPSGHVLVIDAGALLDADAADLRALQQRLREAADEARGAGRTQVGSAARTPYVLAPVSETARPHRVGVVRRGRRPTRLIVELQGPGGAPVPASRGPSGPRDAAAAHPPAAPRKEPHVLERAEAPARADRTSRT